MDDKLDFCQTSSIFGKPTGQDLKLGIATAPVLFASEQYPELKDMFALTASESDIDANMTQQV
jgi:geranylgeranyl pyrophosphate synthase